MKGRAILMTYEELVMKRDEMEYMVSIGVDDYMVRNLLQLYNQCIEVDQLKVPVDSCVPCKKVVQIKRVLPVDALKLSHPELIVWEGVYMTVEGLMIPKNILKSIGYSRKSRLNLENMPEGYVYGTLKDVGKYGFCFKKQEITNYITNSSGWQLFNIHD